MKTLTKIALAVAALGLAGCQPSPSEIAGRKAEREALTAGRLPPGCKYTYVWMPSSPDLHIVICDDRRTTSVNWMRSAGKSQVHEMTVTVEQDS